MRFALSLLVGGALLVSGCGPSSTAADAISVSGSPVDCAGKQLLRASGSTVQQNAIDQFVFAYVRACPGRTLGYDAGGSTVGLEEFASAQTDLVGSDVALDPSKAQPDRMAARCGSPAWHLPVVFNPIAITYNLNGVSSLNLDAPTAAKIFSGSIATWDNPAIKALNAGVPLPPTAIRVVYRSDKPGLTANFQRYLDDASDGAWGGGTGDTFTGTGVDGASDDGAAAALQGTDGAVSYAEWSFALGKRLAMARISMPAGPGPVPVSADSVAKTITGARFVGQGNDLVLDPSSLYQPTEAGAYPIVLPTYEIVCSKYPDAATGPAVKAFLQAAIGPGQEGLDQYGAVPLPQSFRSKLLTTVNTIE